MSTAATASSYKGWLKEESFEDSDDLLEPEDLVADAIEELETAVAGLRRIAKLLENGNGSNSKSKKT